MTNTNREMCQQLLENIPNRQNRINNYLKQALVKLSNQ